MRLINIYQRLAAGVLTCAAVACVPGAGDDPSVEVEAPLTGPIGDPAVSVDITCGSLFAARILEKQIARDPTFPVDCSEPLRVDIEIPRAHPRALRCLAGESPDACRERAYDTPPPISSLRPGCWDSSPGSRNCMRGKWVPKCVDGTDVGCEVPEAVCQDGTRPMAYIEGSAAQSNTWVFHLGGEGGPCSGDQCWLNYRFGSDGGRIAHERAMSSMHPDHLSSTSISGRGLTSGNAASPLASYNRVKWNRCSDAASNGTEIGRLFDVDVTLPADDIITSLTPWGTARVWHKGLDTWRALFRSLTTVQGRDLDGDGRADVPSLAEAEQVLIAGTSDASVWTTIAVDRLRAELQAIAGPGVDVRLLSDGHFSPMLDNQGRYAPGAPADFSLLSHPYTPAVSCELPDDGDPTTADTCSDTGFATDTHVDGRKTKRATMQARSTLLDESCEAFHGPGAPQCYDREHVMVHHLETPVLIVADQEDHTLARSRPAFADDADYAWPTPASYRQLVVDQSADLRDNLFGRLREEGPLARPQFVQLLRKSRRGAAPWGAANHTHFGNDAKMAWQMSFCSATGTRLTSKSISETIAAWADGTLPTNYIAEDASRWDGVSPYWVTGSSCITPE